MLATGHRNTVKSTGNNQGAVLNGRSRRRQGKAWAYWQQRNGGVGSVGNGAGAAAR